MKQLFTILLFIVFANGANAENIKDNCTGNGYPLDDVIKIEKTIQKALKTNDISLFADQFDYPFAINISDKRKRIISNKQELIDNFPLIYSNKDIEEIIAEKNLIPFCRYDGASIFGGIWLTTDKNNQIKGFVINANETTKLASSAPYGVPILPVDDLKILKEFVDMYHNDKSAKITNDDSLKIETEWGTTYQPNLASGDPLKPGYRAFLLYHVDINNDGQPEWILVYPCEGSMCTSGIAAIYKSENHILKTISFDDTVISNFNLGDMSRWYLFIDHPLFTQQKEKIIINFYNKYPAQVCSYLWENSKVTLVHGDQNYCIH